MEKELAGIPCRIAVIPKDRQDKAKMDYIGQLEVAVIQMEGCAVEALLAADVVTQSIGDALDLLRYPLRLAATLRL